jgi:hypothetical protein
MDSKLDYVGEFIRAVNANLSGGTTEELAGLLMSRWGEGSLILDDKEAAAYRSTVDRLNRDFVRQEDLSRRSVERSLEEALFHALDLQQTSGKTFDQRLQEGLKALRAQLNSAPVEFQVLVEVQGLAAKDLPFALGTVRFVKFGSRQRSILLQGQSKGSKRTLVTTVEKLDGKVCAQIKVAARDFDAARSIARREARTAIDCVNFFVDLIPYNHCWLYFSAEGASVAEITPAREATGQVHVGLDRRGPALSYSVEHLRQSSPLLADFRRLGTLYRLAKPKTAADCLLTAFQWAGRATVEPKREESYLLYAIALETAILPTENAELTYRLSTRVAAILGRSRQQRSEMRRTIGHLYAIRSQVAHSGYLEVTEQDLGTMRLLTKRTLLRLVRRRGLWAKNLPDYNAWLESQTEH